MENKSVISLLALLNSNYCSSHLDQFTYYFNKINELHPDYVNNSGGQTLYKRLHELLFIIFNPILERSNVQRLDKIDFAIYHICFWILEIDFVYKKYQRNLPYPQKYQFLFGAKKNSRFLNTDSNYNIKNRNFKADCASRAIQSISNIKQHLKIIFEENRINSRNEYTIKAMKCADSICIVNNYDNKNILKQTLEANQTSPSPSNTGERFTINKIIKLIVDYVLEEKLENLVSINTALCEKNLTDSIYFETEHGNINYV